MAGWDGMKRRVAGIGLAAALLGAAASPSAAEPPAPLDPAQPITALTVPHVVHALKRYDVEFEIQRDAAGDPLIILRQGPLVHDRGAAVMFFGCDEADACRSMTLYTFFRTAQPLPEEVFHLWNDVFRGRTMTRAYRDEDEDSVLVLNMAAEGGLTQGALDYAAGAFLTEMNAFRNALARVGSGARTSGQAPRGSQVQAFQGGEITANAAIKPAPKDRLLETSDQ